MHDWNGLTREEKDAIIGPLWAEGKSAGEIAMHFIGATRNMIIGVVHRRKMPARLKPERVKSTKTKRPPDQVLAKPKPNRNTIVRTETPRPEPRIYFDALNLEREPIRGTTPISILELPNRPGVKCRFPVKGGYCGRPSGDQTYCPTHYRLAYTAPKEKART